MDSALSSLEVKLSPCNNMGYSHNNNNQGGSNNDEYEGGDQGVKE